MKNYIKYLLLISISLLIGISGTLFSQTYKYKLIKDKLFYNQSYCERCGKHWNEIHFHDTWFKYKGEYPDVGVSVLCDNCWWDLKTPQARLPYYKEADNKYWGHTIESSNNWELIKIALFKEKNAYTNEFNYITNNDILVSYKEIKSEETYTWKTNN
jgi:hypothetical protein